jgi:ribosomal-protein-alanine N-acetyltransferase
MTTIMPTMAGDLAAIVPLHQVSFSDAWPREAFETLLGSPGVLMLKAVDTSQSPIFQGFVMARIAADEAEILTIAVDPAYYGGRIGEHLMRAVAVRARAQGAERLFLEVAEDNSAALRLYTRLGFDAVGRRPAYYQRASGDIAALVMRLDLSET